LQKGLSMTDDQLIPLALEIRVFATLLLKFFGDSLDARLKASGAEVSSLQFGFMQILQNEAVTISILSQRFNMEPSTIMRSMDALQAAGYVERGVDPKDRRRNPLYLTDKGRQLMQAVPVIAPQDDALQALETMGMEQTEQLRDLLRDFISQSTDGKMIVMMMAAAAAAQKPQ